MKAATKTITIEGSPIALEIPVGSMKPPNGLSEMIVQDMQSPKGWKWPTKPFTTFDQSLADDVAYCLDWYLGGHEVETFEQNGQTGYRLTSKGYYHYIGA